MALTGMSGLAVSRAVEYAGKGTAQKTYAEIAQRYTRLKDLRYDENINQYLSEKDKKHLDGAIEG